MPRYITEIFTNSGEWGGTHRRTFKFTAKDASKARSTALMLAEKERRARQGCACTRHGASGTRHTCGKMGGIIEADVIFLSRLRIEMKVAKIRLSAEQRCLALLKKPMDVDDEALQLAGICPVTLDALANPSS